MVTKNYAEIIWVEISKNTTYNIMNHTITWICSTPNL